MLQQYPRHEADAEAGKQFKWDSDPTIDLHGRKFHSRFGTSNSTDENDTIFSMRMLRHLIKQRGGNPDWNVGSSEQASFGSRSFCPNADPNCATCPLHGDCKTHEMGENPALFAAKQTLGETASTRDLKDSEGVGGAIDSPSRLRAAGIGLSLMGKIDRPVTNPGTAMKQGPAPKKSKKGTESVASVKSFGIRGILTKRFTEHSLRFRR